MCGIFALLSTTDYCLSDLTPYINAIQHRGPDHSSIVRFSDKIALAFHRLAINDLTSNGNQPFYHPDFPSMALICNGEIYNHKELAEKYKFNLKSKSDCEVVLHMYQRFGLAQTCQELDGYFAFVIADGDQLYAARDPIGIRSLFISERPDKVYIASELKGLPHDTPCEQFPPGTWWSSESRVYTPYINMCEHAIHSQTYTEARETVRLLLEKAVEKRVTMSERPIGCLLSGGLDSSIICALVAKYSATPIHTFSVGFEGSTDCAYARKVAEHLHTIHHEVILTEQDMLEAIPEVIRQIESYDTTTVRASTPMYLLSKYISKHTDIRVIFSGEGSDELSGSYLYFYNAPSEEEFYKETLRLVKDLNYFDVLRCDKSTATNGLEVRVPFLDKDFVEYYLYLHPSLKIPSEFQCEKYLLRDSFEEMLPKEVAWRTKEAFSDGVSGKEKSWYQVIQEYVETLEIPEMEYTFNPPVLKESKWYRMIYNCAYPNQDHLIPYYWLPKWTGDVKDPSARILPVYQSKQ